MKEAQQLHIECKIIQNLSWRFTQRITLPMILHVKLVLKNSRADNPNKDTKSHSNEKQITFIQNVS